MTLGLTPRCHSNDTISWDDISNDETDIAFGELSTEYCYEYKRNVSWKIGIWDTLQLGFFTMNKIFPEQKN